MPRYVRFYLLNGRDGVYFQPFSKMEKILDLMEAGDIGKHWHIEIVSMSQRDYYKLPKSGRSIEGIF